MSGNAHASDAVTFVVPVRNGARWLATVLDAMLTEIGDRPAEVLVVDDGSTDGTPSVLARYRADNRVRVIAGPARGAAAALNLGICSARYGVICQIDQDVVLEPGWLARVLEPLAEPGVAASQGWYTTPRDGGLCARVMGLDLERRYARLRGRYLDHVCTGNTAYRADALRAVQLFDESLGYGYDNDLSYRLRAAGYRLAFARQARSVHRWREGLVAYLRQQYGVGYGRLDVVGKHPRRFAGDDVSGPGMIAHAALTFTGLGLLLLALGSAIAGGPWAAFAIGATVIMGALAIERAVAGVGTASATRDVAGLCFPVLHGLRDVAWAAAVVVWTIRRLAGRPRQPAHSM